MEETTFWFSVDSLDHLRLAALLLAAADELDVVAGVPDPRSPALLLLAR